MNLKTFKHVELLILILQCINIWRIKKNTTVWNFGRPTEIYKWKLQRAFIQLSKDEHHHHHHIIKPLSHVSKVASMSTSSYSALFNVVLLSIYNQTSSSSSSSKPYSGCIEPFQVSIGLPIVAPCTFHTSVLHMWIVSRLLSTCQNHLG